MFELLDNGTRSAETERLRLFFDEMRPHDELTPLPGFYERVRSRIQEIERQSIWVPLIYTRFRVRLVTACLGLLLAALGYVFQAEWDTNGAQYQNTEQGSGTIFSTDVRHQRDAVLAEIVTYRKPN